MEQALYLTTNNRLVYYRCPTSHTVRLIEEKSSKSLHEPHTRIIQSISATHTTFTMSNPKKRAAEDAAPSKKASKKKKKHNIEDESLDTELGVNTLFQRMDNQLLADYLAQRLSRFGSDLSSIEISDISLSAGCIKDTSSWQEDRTSANLPAFMEKFTDKPETLSKPPKKKGAPHTLIVTGAGLRAADLVR